MSVEDHRKILARCGLQTRLIHSEPHRGGPVSPPIWQTSSFAVESADAMAALGEAVQPSEFYTRYGNPNQAQVARCVALVEGAEAGMVTSSGMAAILVTLLSHAQAGDHIVAQTSHYAGTTRLLGSVLPGYGVTATFVDQVDPSSFERAITNNTKLILVETPTNPLMKITDLEAVARIAKAHGIPCVVDNTFATPVNQRPLELGADGVIHSATKYLGGHHDLTLGVLCGDRQLVERAWQLSIVLGGVASPFECWLLQRGLRTLGLRVERQNHSGLRLAEFLSQHDRVAHVHFPGLPDHPQHELAKRQMSGFGSVLSIELHGGYASARALLDSLRLARIAPSLGGIETLVVHPAAMWSREASSDEQRALGIGPGLLRISAGLEDVEDLIEDFRQALDGATVSPSR